MGSAYLLMYLQKIQNPKTMKRNLFLSLIFALTWVVSSAQKGQIWPTSTRQEFEFDAEGNISQEYEVQNYNSYYLFINNNEFIHCTATITSLYKILKREEQEEYVDYEVISEAGNVYSFRFSINDQYVAIYSSKGYGIYLACEAPYATGVFDNLSK